MSIKQLKLTNIQSHVDTVLDFPEFGVIRLYGDNSNGKSVLVKGLWDAISNDMSRPSNRVSLIRRGCMFGELQCVKWDGMELLIHIHKEAAQTFVELKRQDSSITRRYLSDKSIYMLIREFGFHYHDKHDVSVNIHKDDDKFLFTETKYATNYSILESAAIDKYAENTIVELERLHLDVKRRKKETNGQKLSSEAILDAIVICNVEEEADKRDKVAFLLKNLRLCETRPLCEIEAVPEIRMIEKTGCMPTLVYPRIYNKMFVKFPDIIPIVDDLIKLQQGVCPVCGRDFIEEEQHKHG
ncbi:MAG: hypothetical protein LBS29_04780 [Endomicrobium sp.]|jgi:tRNA A37 threonylcarbamoyladenosine biosynthesis protein TsaE|nr:hypothetical protein [Endomicrobium sp.]